jgi:hypothetical protein
MRAAAALPALFSSIKLMVELMMSSVIIPTKSCQSGGFRWKIKSTEAHQLLWITTAPRTLWKSTTYSIGKGYGHDGCSLHDPWQRVPHEPQELEKLALLVTQNASIHHVKHHVDAWNTQGDRNAWITDADSSVPASPPACWARFDALLGLRGGETLAAASQVVEHLLERDVLLQRHKKRITSQFQTTPRGVGQVRGDKRTRFLRRLKDKPRSGNELLHEEGEEQNWCRLGRKKEGAVRIKGGRKKQSLTKKTAATSITAGLQRNGGPRRTDSSRFNSTDGGETATPSEATKFHPTRSTKPGTEEAVGGLTRSTASLSTASRLPPLSSILASLGRRRRKAPEQRENYQSNTAARAPVAGRKETGGNGGRGGARSEIVGGGIR